MRDRWQRFRVGLEIGSDSLCAIDKEPHCARLPGIFSGDKIVHWQGGDGKLALPGKPQSCPAGNQQRHSGAGDEEVADLRTRGYHLLEVIQEQEQAPSVENLQQPVMQRPVTHLA
jgi:hypothetical protein